mmetsp:Transcript_772/g.2008  ORF Transcript_772/g.2008 Transcript_772/m.2008 type:complete len:560 (+) Transcript_772:85-1764(+)
MNKGNERLSKLGRYEKIIPFFALFLLALSLPSLALLQNEMDCDSDPNALSASLRDEIEHEVCISERLHIVVMGASGDLAKKKIYPSLFNLFKNGFLPKETWVVGYARSKMSAEDLHKRFRDNLKVNDEEERAKVAEFLSICKYVYGPYDEEEGYVKLNKTIRENEVAGEPKDCKKHHNRMFYLALPASVFVTVSKGIKGNAMAVDGFTRVVVEKPFGHDLESSNELSEQLKQIFREDQLYRIDHYLGKEMVQNLLTLRFGNRLFQHSWTRGAISSVTITQKEPFGTMGRGGYFDNYGIIRDIMQNHLTQIFSLIAMDQPVGTSAEDVRDMKVQVLKSTKVVTMDDVVLGQYVKSSKPNATGDALYGYKDDETVPKDSVTPTFAMAVLHVHNQRWDGVPFILKCGKALNERKVEIRIQFTEVPGKIIEDATRNELVMRVQPDEAIYMKMSIKRPGLKMHSTQTELDLNYNTRYADVHMPDAYERLLLEVMIGEQHNFVRTDELEQAWRIFTPILKEIEASSTKPIEYEYGSRGPVEADELAARYGFLFDNKYNWKPNNKL